MQVRAGNRRDAMPVFLRPHSKKAEKELIHHPSISTPDSVVFSSLAGGFHKLVRRLQN